MPAPPRIPALDGVRALAVLGVLAAHAGIPGVTGGFIGVDVFFVLSGFLITSLLLEEHSRRGRADLAAFWARRARRLLPAALAMITAVVAARHLLLPDQISGLRGDALAAALWSSNWRFALQGTNYFASGGTASPLQHTWSLAVEEQFYLIWPCLLALAWLGVRSTRYRRGRLLILALLGVVGSAAATFVLTKHATLGRVYFGTDTRAQELLIGAALAAVLAPTWRWHTTPHRARRSPQLLGGRGVPTLLCISGLAVLGVAAHRETGSTQEFQHGLMLVVSLAAAALIAGLVLDSRTVVSRLLSTRVMVDIGAISYGIYLWHWPVFEVMTGARTGLQGYPLAAARVLATMSLAIASMLLVERPVRRAQTRPSRMLPSAIVGVATVLAIIVMITPAGPAQIAGAAIDTPQAVTAVHHAASGPLKGAVKAPAAQARTGAQATGAPLRVDVFGDSIGWTLARYLPASTQVQVTNRATLGCGIVTGGPYRYFGAQYKDNPTCDAWETDWTQQIRTDRPDEVVLMVGRWETMDREVDGTWTHIGDLAFDDYLDTQLDQAIAVLSSTGARVIVATEPYNRRGEQPDGSLYPEDNPSRVDSWNQLVRAQVADHPGTRLLDLNRELCPNGVFTWTVDGVTVRSDGVHLSPAGAYWIAPWFTEQLVTDLR